MTVSKRLDDTDGESAEFDFSDNGAIVGKFVITGTASANIKIFENREERTGKLFYKASCTNWNGASVRLHLKTSDGDDSFSKSDLEFSEDDTRYSEVR